MGAPDNLTLTKQSNGIPGHPSLVMDPRAHDRETLRLIISQWNSNRLDLFELSEPDENFEFNGVMRYYFQEEGSKIATKCIRVSSGQTARQVVEILVEKFRPDMRMLTMPRYGLYEVHANGEERRLREEEKPLLVQLNWHKDDREGRFLLKNEEEYRGLGRQSQRGGEKKATKQEKKDAKRREKEEKIRTANDSLGITATTSSNEPNDAEKLFKQLPETSFHRSISNPEAVMRRRRQQKLEKKLQQFKSKDGGPDTGGTLKIFGETINRDVPYKTLLLSVQDSVESVIKQTLEKYGLERDDYAKYCLVQAVLPPGSPNDVNVDPSLIKETILAATDCPLQILMHFPPSQGILVFNLKRRTEETVGPGSDNGISRPLLVQNPYLIESLPNGVGQAVQLFPGITEVGNDHHRMGSANFFHIASPDVFPTHCFFHRMENSVMVSLAKDRPAMVSVDGRKLDSTAILQNGSLIRIGQSHAFRFCVPPGFGQQQLGSNGGMHNAREKLQLPLVAVAQPTTKKSSPEMTNGNSKYLANGNNSQIATRALNHLDSIECGGDLPDTNSSVTYSHRSSPEMHAIMTRQNNGQTTSKLPILPATLEFREDREDAFLVGVIINPNPVGVNFKLAPTYILYMAARYRGSTNFRPEVVPMERAHLLSKFLRKIATIFSRVVGDNQDHAEYLCFWLANSSELLHLLKLDRHMSMYGTDAHDILSDCVHLAFHHLVRCQQELLQRALPGLFASDDDTAGEEGENGGGWGNVLEVLTRTLQLARRCRLNAALTIHVFCHLFHYTSVWLFNSIVHNPDRCNRHFGTWLRGGLDHLLDWADKHGLEVAAEHHLGKIVQVTNLLNMPKLDAIPSSYASAAPTAQFPSGALLHGMYEPSPEARDRAFTAELIDSVANIAEAHVDELARQNGERVQREEPMQLQLPVVIPEEGYWWELSLACGRVTRILEPLSRKVNLNICICEMVVHPYSQGSWTVYLIPSSGERSPSTSFDGGRQQQFHPTQLHPTVIEVAFPKGNCGIGLSIISYPTPSQAGRLGIYVKAVVKGGSADQDGRLESGDQLLKVNGKSLIGITQEDAAKLIAQTGPTVQMEVLKQGAVANGLATVLASPSPPPPFNPQVNGENNNGGGTMGRAHVHQYPSDFPDREQIMNGFNGGFNGGGGLHNGELVRPVQRQHQQQQHHYPPEATTPTRVLAQPPPPIDYRVAQSSPDGRYQIHGENVNRIHSVIHRSPSPIQDAIATQMINQRDKFRKDAKMYEIEDELRRRREQLQNGHQSPVNGIRAGAPMMNGRAPVMNGHASVSTERLDGRSVNGNGKPPTEKRVQWAIDSPMKSSSPTTSQHSSSPTGPIRKDTASHPRIPVLPNPHAQSPVTVPDRSFSSTVLHEVPPWPRANGTRDNEQSSAPIAPATAQWNIPDDYERLKQWKQQEMRRFRDEEISSLESRLEGSLAPNEEERLRILRLERDFERRAAENRHGHDTEPDEDNDDEEDGEEEEEREMMARLPALPKMPLAKPTPHLHHPAAAAAPEVYKTRQQEDYDSFVKRHEVHAVNEAIRRSREHLDRVPTVRFQEPQVQQQTYSLPEISRHSTSPPRKMQESHRLSTGAEIRREVEAAKAPAASASVVGVYEVYNDPRNRILNAKVKLPIGTTEASPEKLSFRDKMKMFAMTVGEDPADRVMASSKQREIDYSHEY
ncbi:Afadin [Hypsibius exemplaris]|uniref:Afadin n=1 Tax=Hypsibius exemplaris TaxID=2072580 RepID=A0A1W0X7G9_HYPEX|nr:Afadin [Hypsibius exemplaris]